MSRPSGHSQDVGDDTQGPHIYGLPVGFLLQELWGWQPEADRQTDMSAQARTHVMPSRATPGVLIQPQAAGVLGPGALASPGSPAPSPQQ